MFYILSPNVTFNTMPQTDPNNTRHIRDLYPPNYFNPDANSGSDYDLDVWYKRQATSDPPTKTPGPAPANSYGWICPRCKSVWAPHVTKCDCG